MTGSPESPQQVQCTCRCRDEKPAFALQAESWNEALRQHKGNYIDVVTKRLPLIAWIYPLLRVAPPKLEQVGYRISLAEMHRMHMRALQVELVRIGVALQFDNSNENASEDKKMRLQDARKNLEPVLGKYTQAIRDYEYMTTSSRAYDYFIVSSERHHDRTVILDAMDDYFTSMEDMYNQKQDRALPTGPWEYLKHGRAEPIGGTRNDSIKRLLRHAFWWKLSAAIVGAGFLVGPMWLLALEQRLYLQLEATTGFVFGFGLVLAYFVDKIDQVFAGTLAYAAVLMVFVGLSIQGAEGD